MNTGYELRSIAKGAIYSFFGNGFGMLLEYLFILLLARFSGIEILGLFFLAVTLINILAIFSRLGLTDGVLRYVSIYNGQSDFARAKGVFLFSFWLVMATGFLFSFLLFVNADSIAVAFDRSNLSILIKAFSFSLPFVAVSKILFSGFQAFHKMKMAAFLQGMVLPLSMTSIYLVLFYFEIGFVSVGVAYTVSYFIFCLWAYKNIAHLWKRKIHPDFYGYINVLKFSFPLTTVGLFLLTYGQIEVIILGWFRSIVEVGVFGVILKLSLICLAVCSSLNYVFSPIVADLHNQMEIKRLEKIFKTITRWTITLSLPVYLLIIVNSESILRIFGKDYIIGSLPLFILCTGQLIDFSTGSVAAILTMTGKSFITLINSVVFLLINLIMDVLLIPYYGIMGAAIGIATALSIVNLLRLVQVHYFLKIHPYSFRTLVPIFSIILVFALIYFANILFATGMVKSLIYTAFGFIIYGTIIVFTIQADDREMFIYILERSFGKLQNLFNNSKQSNDLSGTD